VVTLRHNEHPTTRRTSTGLGTWLTPNRNYEMKVKTVGVPGVPRKKDKGQTKNVTKQVVAVEKAAEKKVESDLAKQLNQALRMATRGAGVAAGTALGSLVGMPAAGAAAGDFVSRVFGMGDYDVKVNSLFKPGSEEPLLRTFTPEFGGAGADLVRVRHREYVGLVTSAPTVVGGFTPFNSTRYRFNMGNPQLCPYTAGSVALGFKEYLPLGAIVELVPLASEVSTSATLGSMGVAIDYDSTDPMYASKQQAAESDGARTCRPTDKLLFGIECDPSKRPTPWLFNRFGPVSSNLTQAVNSYDLGAIQVFTEGMSVANTAAAEMYFSYDSLFGKKLMQGGPIGAGVTSMMLNTSASAGSFTAAAPLGPLTSYTLSQTGATVSPGSTGVTFGGLMTGVFQVLLAFQNVTAGGGLPLSNAQINSMLTNCTLVGNINQTTGIIPISSGVSGTTGFLTFAIQLQGSAIQPPVILWTGYSGWSLASVTQAQLLITQLGQQPVYGPSTSSIAPVTGLNGVSQGIGWN